MRLFEILLRRETWSFQTETESRVHVNTIVYTRAWYQPKFTTKEEIIAKTGITDDERVKAMMKDLDTVTITELRKCDAINRAIHTCLTKLMAQSSIEVLETDLKYKENDKLRNPNPLTTWNCITRKLISERDGDSIHERLRAKFELIRQYNGLKQGRSESIADYIDIYQLNNQ